MKLIIAGSRTFTDYHFIKLTLDKILSHVDEEIEIVSGACRGVDKLGELYAREYGYSIKIFTPDWKNNKLGAGFKRNMQMAEYATHCVCFWDGISKGTKHMIDLATKYQLPLRVITVKQPTA